MPATFVVVPQWQGSGSSRSMRLIDGAEAIRGDLPSARTTVVEVPNGAGDAVGTGVQRYSSVATTRDRLREALRRLPEGETPVVIGGDCGIELGAVEHALRQHPDLALVWFDAHPDLNTPETSPSGAFHGMVVRAIVGEAAEGLGAEPALDAGRLVLAGVRACDEAEDAWIREHDVALVEAADLASPDALVQAVADTGATAVYLHVDLDVLDPEEIRGVDFPEPFGVGAAALADAIRALRGRFELVGAGITEFSPPSPAEADADLSVILRLLSAFTAPLQA